MGQRLGQHFLNDRKSIEGIVSEISTLTEHFGVDTIIEIGPGQGVLTRELLTLCAKKSLACIALEKDTGMEKHLRPYMGQGLELIWGDVLDLDLTDNLVLSDKIQNISKVLVVGNLPYYITSPIFRKFFSSSVFSEVHLFPGGVFLIQKEVAEKIMTGAAKKSYLRWILGVHYTVEYCFTVPPGAFTPPPKVDSAVVSFRKKNKPELGIEKEKTLLHILNHISPYKRKTLGKIQKMLEGKIHIPENLHTKRLEELNREEMREIIEMIDHIG